MPQMAPLLWLYLMFFFLTSLSLFLILNYFIKPFKDSSLPNFTTSSFNKPWKL